MMDRHYFMKEKKFSLSPSDCKIEAGYPSILSFIKYVTYTNKRRNILQLYFLSERWL